MPISVRILPVAINPPNPTLAVPPNPPHQQTAGEGKKKSSRGDFAAMAGDPPTAAEKETLLSSFLEIAAGQTPETATQFLQVWFPPSPQNQSP